ncbi:hypothetical protein AGMMS50267_13640 [Spirochaetia bacterium]|nr:hypothetical protein AGMMS50267_13640 [Spirochaetia bacterium]
MKKNKKGSGAFKSLLMLGMVALMCAIGLVLAGCDNGNGGGGDEKPSLAEAKAEMLAVYDTNPGEFASFVAGLGVDGFDTSALAGNPNQWTDAQWTAVYQFMLDHGYFDEGTEGTDPTPPGGNTAANSFVTHYLGGPAYAQANGSTITLIQDVTLSNSGSLTDGLTLVIPAGKKLINTTEQLYVRGSAKIVVKGAGSIELGGSLNSIGGINTGSLFFEDESKLILEQGGTLKILKAGDPGSNSTGSLLVRIGAGIYGGTADAPNIGKTKLSGVRETNSAGTDKLKIVVAGSTNRPYYSVSVVPNTEPTINSLYLVMGKTQYSVGQDCNALSGVDADSNEASTSFADGCYLAVGDDFSTHLGGLDWRYDRPAITLTGL